jgi:hypothetical protein
MFFEFFIVEQKEDLENRNSFYLLVYRDGEMVQAHNKRIYASMADLLTMSIRIYFISSFGGKNSNER